MNKYSLSTSHSPKYILSILRMAIGYVTGLCYTMSNGIKKYGNPSFGGIHEDPYLLVSRYRNPSVPSIIEPINYYYIYDSSDNLIATYEFPYINALVPNKEFRNKAEYLIYKIGYNSDSYSYINATLNTHNTSYCYLQLIDYDTILYKYPFCYFNFNKKSSSEAPDNTPHTIGVGMSAAFVSNRLKAPSSNKYELTAVINGHSINIIAQGRNAGQITIKNNESITSLIIISPIYYYNFYEARTIFYPTNSKINEATISLYYSDGSIKIGSLNMPIPYKYGSAHLTDIMFNN